MITTIEVEREVGIGVVVPLPTPACQPLRSESR